MLKLQSKSPNTKKKNHYTAIKLIHTKFNTPSIIQWYTKKKNHYTTIKLIQAKFDTPVLYNAMQATPKLVFKL